ncbi:MAG: dTDP-4-dehydrorhamnose 3,5-epimerase family protein [Candidatus Bathyarchaeia archaeon]
MLEGIKVKTIDRFIDERGYFTELMRKDWTDLFGEDKIVQINHSFTYPNIIRAWHRHLRGQVDYFLALKGTIKIGVYDDESGELDEIVTSGLKLQVVRVPGLYWHGFKAVGDEPVMLVYFTTNLYDPSDPDEERRAWNDPTIIPKIVNGKKNDSRVGKPWDWNLSPNK